MGFFRRLNINRKQKVFCIGFNKTGTTSLEQALLDLNYKLGDQNAAQQLVSNYKDRNFNAIVKFCETGNAFQDAPFSWPFTFMFLEQAYPNARFILSVRNDSEQWYNSLIRFHSSLMTDGGKIPSYDDMLAYSRSKKSSIWSNMVAKFDIDKDDPYNKDILIGYYEQHNSMVKEYFRFKSNLLVINISHNSSYQKFCEFLDEKPLYQSFPWKNKTV